MPDPITIFEVGPRDGLQNEERLIGTAHKIKLIDLLSLCGFKKIEAASFVSSKWAPQMADSDEVMARISRKPGVSYAALTPNIKGYERARISAADEIAIFASASETFSKRNINCSIDESFERFKPVLDAAHRDGILVRGYVSCVVACPYEGEIEPAKVAQITDKLIDAGCYGVSLGDTIGKGTPASIGAMLDAVLEITSVDKLAGHYHDTDGNAVDNIRVSIEKGLREFDSAVGGLGGCPYAPGAKGNVDTRKVVDLAMEMGFETGIALDKLAIAEAHLAGLTEIPGQTNG